MLWEPTRQRSARRPGWICSYTRESTNRLTWPRSWLSVLAGSSDRQGGLHGRDVASLTARVEEFQELVAELSSQLEGGEETLNNQLVDIEERIDKLESRAVDRRKVRGREMTGDHVGRLAGDCNRLVLRSSDWSRLSSCTR